MDQARQDDWSNAALRGAAAIALIVASCPAQAQARDFPNRPVRMIEPFTAGGGEDALGRTLVRKLSEIFQQQIVFDNRAGASGIIGTEITAKAAPDGYTIVYISENVNHPLDFLKGSV